MNGVPGLTHREFSRKGGSAKSEAKLKAAAANLRRAKAAKAAKRNSNGNERTIS
jgi:hypothetical protein